MKGRDKPKWIRAMANDIGCLFQVIRDTNGTGIYFIIHRNEYPQDIKVTYIYIVLEIIPQKKETHRV